MKNCSFEYKKFQPCLTLETKKFSYFSDFINNSPKGLKNNMVAHEIDCIDSSKSAIEIDNTKCISCMFCVFSCPGNLINIDDKYKLNSQCSDCGKIDFRNDVSSENNLIKLPIIKSLKSKIKYKSFEDFTGINETKNISVWGAKVIEFLAKEDNPKVALEVGMKIKSRNRGGRMDICASSGGNLFVAEAKITFHKMMDEDRYHSQIIAYKKEIKNILKSKTFYTFLLIGGEETDLLPFDNQKCTSNVGNRSKTFYQNLKKHGIKFISANGLLKLGLMKLKFGNFYSLDYLASLFDDASVVGVLSSGIIVLENQSLIIKNFYEPS